MAAETQALIGLPALLEPALSKDRIDYWTAIAGGDPEKGLILHQRNTVVAAALFGDLQILEIALRNSVDRELQNQVSPVWLNNQQFLALRGMADAQRAAESDRRRRGIAATTRDKIIINLTFRFWTGIVADSKLLPDLKPVFPHSARRRRDLILDLHSLVRLRNDAVHHEPVIDRDGVRRSESLNADLDKLYRLLSGISPEISKWAKANSLALPYLKAGLATCGQFEGAEVVINVP